MRVVAAVAVVACVLHVLVPAVHAQCVNQISGAASAPVTNATLSICPMFRANESVCCTANMLMGINQTLSVYELLTGDQNNTCYLYLRQMACAACNLTSSSYMNGTHVGLCREDCDNLLYPACQAYLFARPNFCGIYRNTSYTCFRLARGGASTSASLAASVLLVVALAVLGVSWMGGA